MAKRKSAKKTPQSATLQNTITIVVPDQLANLDQDTLNGIARLILGDTAKFDVSNLVVVKQSNLSSPAVTALAAPANVVAESGCP